MTRKLSPLKKRNESIKGDTLRFIVQMMGLSYYPPKFISMDKALNLKKKTGQKFTLK